MVAQRAVFRAIRRDVDQKGLEHAKKKIDKYQQRLYALDLTGKIYFYAQDEHGIPVERAYTEINGARTYSTLLVRNKLDTKAWQLVERPENWRWSMWPPSKRNDLLGCRNVCENCAECGDSTAYDETPCDDYFFTWVLQKLDYWQMNINIQRDKNTGFGLYARHRIPKGTYLGEYTGMIVPWYEGDDDSETSYYMQIGCGPIGHSTEKIFHCRLDATNRGSVFRFLNHSCEPSAEVREMRHGLHNRINVVVTTRVIESNEQITITYNDSWFNDRNPCYCRTKSCMNKPKRKDRDHISSGRRTVSGPRHVR